MKKRAVRGVVAGGDVAGPVVVRVLAVAASQCLGSPLATETEMMDSPSASLSLATRGGVGGDGNLGDAEAAGGFGEGGGGAAVGPAAAEGDVDAEAELAAFGLGVVDVVEELGGEEGEVLEAFGGVVEDLRVLEGELGAADAVGLHLLELAEDLGLLRRRDRTTTSAPWAWRWLGGFWKFWWRVWMEVCAAAGVDLGAGESCGGQGKCCVAVRLGE